MPIQEFIQNLKDGKVSFNWNGHNSHHSEEAHQDEIRMFIETLKRRINLLKGIPCTAWGVWRMTVTRFLSTAPVEPRLWANGESRKA